MTHPSTPQATITGIAETPYVRRAADLAKRGDLVVVFSNGGFDGVHAKLLDAFKAKR